MTGRRRSYGRGIAVLLIAALLLLIGAFSVLPHAKAPEDAVIGGAVLAVVGVVDVIRIRRART